MNAICTYENIKKALRAVEGMVGKELSIPIIANILISAEDNVLSFSATNLEIGVVQKIPAKTEGSWKMVIAPQLITGFLSAIRGGEHITLTKVDDELIVKNDTYESVIKGFDAEDFPLIPEVKEVGVEMNLLVLKENISQVLSFVTHSEIRPELTGVHLYTEGDYLFCAATDSFRLGERKQKISSIVTDKKDFSCRVILPQKICTYINRLDDSYKTILWTIHDNHLSIVCDQLYITTRLIDGNYPDYTQIIPQKTETNIIVKKDDFLESMRVMMVFSEKDVNEITLNIQEEKIAINTRKHEQGKSETVLDASISGDPQELVVNPRYIYEGIQNINQSEVFIGINSSSAPILFRGSNTEGIFEDYTYIVMPIKNNS